MPALNPITHADAWKLAAALAVDPDTAAEERLKQILYLWFGFYFSGTAFNTLLPNGGTVAKTFTHCLIDVQDGKLPENAQRPVIHLVMPDRKTRRTDLATGTRGHDDDWTISVFVKVPSSLSDTEMKGVDPDYIAAKVAGELDWLLCSKERQALTEEGITQVRLAKPSVILPPTTWKMRMAVMTCRTRRQQAR